MQSLIQATGAIKNLMRLFLFLGFLLSSLFCFAGKNSKPNIIIIYADDLGYGDIQAFSDTDIRTPHLNKLADKGIKFTSFYSVSPVCSPSRFGLLTGRYPIRRGMDSSVFWPESFTGMPNDEITIAELVKQAGYKTSIVGKWHLGHVAKYLPIYQGFDEFYGVPYSNDMSSFVLMEDEKVIDFAPDQSQLTKLYTEQSIDFIRRNKNNPFFLYLSHSMPHVPLYASEEFSGKSKQGIYGDVIEEMDWSVGQIIKTLKKLKIAKNTLVVFSSDNGPWLGMGKHGGSSGVLTGGKFTTFEGGVRVPTIASWPSKIKSSVYHNPASMADWFPTIADIIGLDLPKNKAIDGVSLSPIFKGKFNQQERILPYFEKGKITAVRMGDWKLKLAHPGRAEHLVDIGWPGGYKAHEDLLFNLVEDPGEKNDLAAKHPELVNKLKLAIKKISEDLGKIPERVVSRSKADLSTYEWRKQQIEKLKTQKAN